MGSSRQCLWVRQLVSGSAVLAALQELKAESVSGGHSNYINMLRLLQRLRQACNHPWLVRGEADSNMPGLVPTAQLAAARKLDPSIRNDLLEALQVTVLVSKAVWGMCSLVPLTGHGPMSPCWIADATAQQQA